MAKYAVVDLGTLGGAISEAFGINNTGPGVVGRSTPGAIADGSHAFRWVAGSMNDLGTLGEKNSVGAGVNDQGQIVGTSYAPGHEHAFLYDSGNLVDLDPLLSSSSSAASDINKDGVVVGRACFGLGGQAGTGHAFMFDSKNSTVKDLGTLPGRAISTAMAVNDFGQVVGGSRSPDLSHPFLYDNGQMIDISPNNPGTAWGINNKGQVVGSTIPGGPFMYEHGTGTKYLATGGDGLAYDINDAAEVVGYNVQGAWIWTEQTGLVDLNTLVPAYSGWHLGRAHRINDKGEIVGTGTYQGQVHGFLLVSPDSLGPLIPEKELTKEMAVEILFGVTQDGGGLAIKPGGTPQPIDPWGPLRESLSASIRELMIRAMLAGAASVTDSVVLRPEVKESVPRLPRAGGPKTSTNAVRKPRRGAPGTRRQG